MKKLKKNFQKLAESSDNSGKNNISFLSYFLLGNIDKCLDILIKTDRLPEAAFFARTYVPSRISSVVKLWKDKLSAVNEKAGQSLADPEQYENLFPGYRESLEVEKFMREKCKKRIPASEYPNCLVSIKYCKFFQLLCLKKVINSISLVQKSSM